MHVLEEGTKHRYVVEIHLKQVLVFYKNAKLHTCESKKPTRLEVENTWCVADDFIHRKDVGSLVLFWIQIQLDTALS